MNILITSALSAKAHQLKNKLSAELIILGDHNDIPAFMLNQGKMIRLPAPQSASYAHQMLTLCLDNGVDLLYILDNNEAEALLDANQLFAEYNIDIQVSTNEI